MVFREPVHKIIDRIKNEPFFRWPNKMGGDSSRRNQNLYCTYHRDKGHTTEQCRVLKDHLEQLVKVGHLKEFVVESEKRGAGLGAQQKGNLLPPPLGVIEVIHATPRGTNAAGSRVLAVASTGECPENQQPIKKMKSQSEPIAFDDEDLDGTIQPHDDALVITAWISGFLVKRVMVDQGSRADVMYPDLTKYDSPLVSFNERMVIPQDQISLPVSMEGKEVMVTFVVVNSFSSYTAILGRPWIHAMGPILSTLHMKVKFRTEQGIATVRGNQQVARQCLIAAVRWKDEQAKHKKIAKEVPL